MIHPAGRSEPEPGGSGRPERSALRGGLEPLLGAAIPRVAPAPPMHLDSAPLAPLPPSDGARVSARAVVEPAARSARVPRREQNQSPAHSASVRPGDRAVPPRPAHHGGILHALYALAYLESGDPEAAERVVLDAFVALCSGATPAPLCARQRWRQLAAHVHVVIEAPDTGTGSGAPPFRDAELSSVQREAIALHLGDATDRQAARLLGLTVAGFRRQLRAGLEALVPLRLPDSGRRTDPPDPARRRGPVPGEPPLPGAGPGPGSRQSFIPGPGAGADHGPTWAAVTGPGGAQLLDLVVQRLAAAAFALEGTARLAPDPRVGQILEDVVDELGAAASTIRRASIALTPPWCAPPP